MSEKLKIQDLRLGNYILENGDISKVVQLDTGGKSFCEINNIKVHKLTGAEINSHKVIFEPIHLTSEILLACGFTHHFVSIKGQDFFTLYFNDIVKLIVNLNSKKVIISIDVLGVVLSFDYTFFHQLQNLYFSLTNQELKFKTELK